MSFTVKELLENAKSDAVKIFASKGIHLNDPSKHEYSWAHDAYHVSDPETKDIEVRIYDKNHKVVHRKQLQNIHHEDAKKAAQKVKDDYVKGLK